MLCVISGANWNNAAIAGVWALNLNNVRGNSNNNYGFRSDSVPNTPYTACADWQRGSLCRALRRNVWLHSPLVTLARRVVGFVKIGFGALA
jgi:hypothetical protein